MSQLSLYIVYNANAGLLNGVKDSLHKLISPSTYPCKLCELTHGYLKERSEWAVYVAELKERGIRFEVLHKDELTQHPFEFAELPGVYKLDRGEWTCILGASQLKKLNSVSDLIATLKLELNQ
jgi:hypothetical protein